VFDHKIWYKISLDGWQHISKKNSNKSQKYFKNIFETKFHIFSKISKNSFQHKLGSENFSKKRLFPKNIFSQTGICNPSNPTLPSPYTWLTYYRKTNSPKTFQKKILKIFRKFSKNIQKKSESSQKFSRNFLKNFQKTNSIIFQK
jgi:hypothetical protein